MSYFFNMRVTINELREIEEALNDNRIDDAKEEVQNYIHELRNALSYEPDTEYNMLIDALLDKTDSTMSNSEIAETIKENCDKVITDEE